MWAKGLNHGKECGSIMAVRIQRAYFLTCLFLTSYACLQIPFVLLYYDSIKGMRGKGNTCILMQGPLGDEARGMSRNEQMVKMRPATFNTLQCGSCHFRHSSSPFMVNLARQQSMAQQRMSASLLHAGEMMKSKSFLPARRRSVMKAVVVEKYSIAPY